MYSTAYTKRFIVCELACAKVIEMRNKTEKTKAQNLF